MRVSTFQIHTQASEQLQALGAQTSKTQQQIGLGKKLLSPSDDPVGAARLVDLNHEIEARRQYVDNIDAADSHLALQDSILAQMIDVLQRVSELTLQAGSGIQTLEDRQFIASEIEIRFEEMIALANTQNAAGQYIFGGFQGKQAPFEVAGDSVVYSGDQGQRRVQIDRGQSIAISDSGDAIFMDIPSDLVHGVARINNSETAALSDIRIVDQELAQALLPDELVIEFRPLSEGGGAPNFTVKRLSDQRPVDGLVNVPYTGLGDIEAQGIVFQIEGVPQPGDKFGVAVTAHNSLFDTVREAALGLKNIDAAAQPEDFRRLIDATVGSLNEATNSILETRADIGARFNSLAGARNLHEDLDLQLQALRSDIEDLDFTEAVSDLAYQSFVLEAAQQSFIRINGLSLFNRL